MAIRKVVHADCEAGSIILSLHPQSLRSKILILEAGKGDNWISKDDWYRLVAEVDEILTEEGN